MLNQKFTRRLLKIICLLFVGVGMTLSSFNDTRCSGQECATLPDELRFGYWITVFGLSSEIQPELVDVHCSRFEFTGDSFIDEDDVNFLAEKIIRFRSSGPFPGWEEFNFEAAPSGVNDKLDEFDLFRYFDLVSPEFDHFCQTIQPIFTHIADILPGDLDFDEEINMEDGATLLANLNQPIPLDWIKHTLAVM